MTYKIGWLIPDRVIETAAPANTDDAFIATLNADLIALLNSAPQPVIIIVDARNIKTYPSAQAAMQMTYYKHPNTQRLITIGLTTNPVLRFLGSLIGHGVGIQIKDFASREEALAYLATLQDA